MEKNRKINRSGKMASSSEEQITQETKIRRDIKKAVERVETKRKKILRESAKKTARERLSRP